MREDLVMVRMVVMVWWVCDGERYDIVVDL